MANTPFTVSWEMLGPVEEDLVTFCQLQLGYSDFQIKHILNLSKEYLDNSDELGSASNPNRRSALRERDRESEAAEDNICSA